MLEISTSGLMSGDGKRSKPFRAQPPRPSSTLLTTAAVPHQQGIKSPIKDSRLKHIADDLAIIRLVLDYQDALAHAASTCRSTAKCQADTVATSII
jgi:hypothetical protein